MKSTRITRWFTRLAIPAALLGASAAAHAAPLKVGYSDWPGYVAWQIAIDKGWIKQAGLDVDFEWFDYSASLDAFIGAIDPALILETVRSGVCGIGRGDRVLKV